MTVQAVKIKERPGPGIVTVQCHAVLPRTKSDDCLGNASPGGKRAHRNELRIFAQYCQPLPLSAHMCFTSDHHNDNDKH